MAVFKKRASAKKRGRRKLQQGTAVLDFRVQRIKDVKAGLKRRGAIQVDAGTEAQLRGLG